MTVKFPDEPFNIKALIPFTIYYSVNSITIRGEMIIRKRFLLFFRGLLKIQFPLIISPREARGGKTGLPSQRHGMWLKKEIIEFLGSTRISVK